jgi:hypothetical protein
VQRHGLDQPPPAVTWIVSGPSVGGQLPGFPGRSVFPHLAGRPAVVGMPGHQLRPSSLHSSSHTGGGHLRSRVLGHRRSNAAIRCRLSVLADLFSCADGPAGRGPTFPNGVPLPGVTGP